MLIMPPSGDRGTMAGAVQFAPYPAGTTQVFHRIVVGGDIKTGAGLTGSRVGLSFPQFARKCAGESHRLATSRGADEG